MISVIRASRFTLQIFNVTRCYLCRLAAWTASSRTRCNMSVTSLLAFSTTSSKPRASLAFFAAIERPLTWDVMRSAMAKPAASSAALLILLPEESRSMACCRSLPLDAKDRCALIEAMLVLTTMLIS